jgi:hypothetical protein
MSGVAVLRGVAVGVDVAAGKFAQPPTPTISIRANNQEKEIVILEPHFWLVLFYNQRYTAVLCIVPIKSLAKARVIWMDAVLRKKDTPTGYQNRRSPDDNGISFDERG